MGDNAKFEELNTTLLSKLKTYLNNLNNTQNRLDKNDNFFQDREKSQADKIELIGVKKS